MPKIAGFSNQETSNWTFNEYLSCVYEQDRAKVINQICKKLKDSKDAITQYRIRLINKYGKILWVNLYSKKITDLNKPTLLITLNPISKDEVNHTFKNNTIEIDLPDEIYNELKFLCKKFNTKISKKVKEILISAVESSEIENF